ncbi:MAG: hypothetical protein WCI71_14475 [Bacteroidota bacterium]
MNLTIHRHLIVFFLFLSLLSGAFAQDSVPSLSAQPRKPDGFWRRVSVGGNVGFQFGSITGITLSPEVSIRAVDQLYVGFRFIYQYYNYKNYFYNTQTGEDLDFQSSVYGGGIYMRYYLASLFSNFLGNIFAHVEYEYLAYSRPFVQSGPPPDGYILDPYRYWYRPGNEVIEINSIFVGAGYRQPISNRVSMDILILFNLNDTYNSPYSNPIFRLGVGVGL